jgi:hypothetical protein
MAVVVRDATVDQFSLNDVKNMLSDMLYAVVKDGAVDIVLPDKATLLPGAAADPSISELLRTREQLPQWDTRALTSVIMTDTDKILLRRAAVREMELDPASGVALFRFRTSDKTLSLSPE